MEQTEYAEAQQVRRTWSEELWDEGERKGKLEGERKGTQHLVADLCELLGIELTPARQAQIEQMDLGQLTALRTHLKARRCWPTEA